MMSSMTKFRFAALACASFALFGASQALAAGDPAKGKTVFNQCRACHRIGPNARNAVGPELNGVIGRKAGTAKGYNYSKANKNSGMTWDEATFRKYIKNPRKVVPGTKMAFAGIKGSTADTKIDNLIAFLKQYDADGKMKK